MVADHITSSLLEYGFYPHIDYQLSANQYDGIVRIALYTSNKKVYKIFVNVLESHAFSSDDIVLAISQIEAELKMKAEYELGIVSNILCEAQNLLWVDYKNMGYTEYPVLSARSYISSELSLHKKGAKAYKTTALSYDIHNCQVELRPLSLYVILSLSSVVREMLTAKQKYAYDCGDAWEHFSENIGYTNYITVPKNGTLTNDIIGIYSRVVKIFSHTSLQKRLVNYAKKDFCSVDPFYTDADIYASSGHFVGLKEFKKQATVENVKKILDKIEFTHSTT